MKKYFFRISWSLINDCTRIKNGKLLYWSTIPKNARYDIKDTIKEVFNLERNSCVLIDNIRRLSSSGNL